MTGAIRRKAGVMALAPIVIGLSACGTPTTATSLVAQGLKAQLAGDTSTAENTYQQAIKLDPNNAVARYDLGTVYDRQGNTSQAVIEYTRAVVISPAFTDALFNLAVDTARSDAASAYSLYLRVLNLSPSFAAAWLNIGFILEGEGKTADALSDWAKATSIDPSLASRLPAVAHSSPTPTTTPTPKP
jgi:tetratricopeptide (TPR) repeat protein